MTTTVSGSLRISRILITIVTLLYGALPLLADLTETHVFHPDWTPHARFHMVWLLATLCSVALLALYLMWFSRTDASVRIRLAGVIGLCAMGGFFVAALTKDAYGGSLTDPVGGVPPLMGMDANLVVFLPILALLIVGLWVGNRRNPEEKAKQ